MAEVKRTTAATARALVHLTDAHGYDATDKKAALNLAIKLLKESGQMGSITSLGQLDPYTGYNVDPTDSLQQQINTAGYKVEPISPQIKTIKPKEKHMFGFAKEYLEKHKDTVMTVLVALFIDHFFLGGALREKIKGITEGILDSAQKKLSHTPNAEKKDAA